ncbi:hypothetical protein [uncultured Draconibacterium sp.]|uniref:hypothetical protein n=1 Tax=uncultured Draconibacterium sp. TaxID=1573823 RepID=UPI0029C96987|nr:hypothetical protein [uncultured Draconibacterium sp.]
MDLSRENFWKPLEDKINSLKFRGSYGVLGNQNVGLYTFAQLLSVGQSNWLSNNAPLNYMGIPDPLPGTVTWEKTSTLDFGADLAFLNNRLQASFDWYKKNTTDMYLPGEPLPSVFGASEPKENIADLNVTGFELSISYRTTFDVKSKPLNLSATLNVSNFVAEITKYPNPEGVMSDAWEGQKLGEIWGYRVDGQFQSDEEAKAYQESFANPTSDLGQVYSFIMNTVQNEEWKGLRAGDIKFLDLDNDGEISRGDYTLEDHGDIEVIGNAMPKFPFGFNINGEWNGFDFSMVGTGVLKQDWYPEGKIYWGSYERPYMTFIRKDLIENAWSEENSKGKYPQIQRGYAAMKSSRSLGAVNDYYLTNIGYMRIKNLTLGYTLPVSLTKKVNIKKVRLFVSAENVFTIRFGDLTKYIDPEQAGSGISYSDPAGATKRSSVEDYPMGKIYSFGINVSL